MKIVLQLHGPLNTEWICFDEDTYDPTPIDADTPAKNNVGYGISAMEALSEFLDGLLQPQPTQAQLDKDIEMKAFERDMEDYE